MVFTIVTIVFLPLSFIAAFFTINIAEFPRGHDGNESLPLGYVSKYMFGIGFAISIPLIVIALILDDIGVIFRALKGKLGQRKRRKVEDVMYDGSGNGSGTTTLEAIKLEQVFSTARSGRRSHDSRWLDRPLSRGTVATVGRREKQTGFRMRVSQDIERGLADVAH